MTVLDERVQWLNSAENFWSFIGRHVTERVDVSPTVPRPRCSIFLFLGLCCSCACASPREGSMGPVTRPQQDPSGVSGRGLRVAAHP